MSTVAEHYAKHLGPIYLWMAGGPEAALQAGGAEIAALNLPLAEGAAVCDLGAGFGMHAIPLARRGARHALKSSDTCGSLRSRWLTMTLRSKPHHGSTGGHPVHAETRLRICQSSMLSIASSQALPPHCCRGGLFIASFRDYSVPLVGDQRFIPVRSDDTRILTCFLEYEPTAVIVHDILHQRTSEGWQTRVSHYRKLRLSPEQLIASLRSNGFNVRREAGMRGMVRLVAQSV